MPSRKSAPTTGSIRDPWPLREIVVGERSRSMTRHMARLALDLARLLEGENDPELDFIAARQREIWGVLHRGGGTLEEHESDLWDQLHGPEAWKEAIEEERQGEAERLAEKMFPGVLRMSEEELVVVGRLDAEHQYAQVKDDAPTPINPAKTRGKVKNLQAPQPAVQPAVSTSGTRAARNNKRKAGDDKGVDDQAARPAAKKSRRTRSENLTINGTAAMAGSQVRPPVTWYQAADESWWEVPGATGRPDWAVAERVV